MNAKQQYEQWRHERPAADPGHADEQADCEPGSRIQELGREPCAHRRGPDVCRFDEKPTLICKSRPVGFRSMLRSGQHTTDRRPTPGSVVWRSPAGDGTERSRRIAPGNRLRLQHDAFLAVLRSPWNVAPWRPSVRGGLYRIVDLVSQVYSLLNPNPLIPCQSSITIERKK